MVGAISATTPLSQQPVDPSGGHPLRRRQGGPIIGSASPVVCPKLEQLLAEERGLLVAWARLKAMRSARCGS